MAAPSAPGVPAPAPSEAGIPEAADRDLPQTFFLGRYRVVDEIGIGGMASVHLARVDGPGGFQKWVAIKRIHPHLVEDDQFVDMFLDEARIAAGINHANVAQVFDLGKDDNTYWIAMEYLHGEPLREVMRRVEEASTQIPFHVAARVVADAAEGLHGAHELRGRNGQLLNLVHRDVTPHNLFVTYDGYTKVVDFGIAKVVDRLASTRAGTLKGKLAYMSPEQVRGQDVDRRTDVFALGVVLWELTTGRRLFRRDTDLDTLEQVQACVVPLPSTIAADFPPELEEVVMRALSQRREDRFQTAREFSRALQRFLMKQGIFVGPEDVGDFVQGLFTDRVAKRERYLEWAAEVTSAVDLDQLQAQQQQAEQNAPSLLHATPESSRSGAPFPPRSSSRLGLPESRASAPGARSAPHNARSDGQDSAAAAVVAALPQGLASHSLMDEDEDIPTIVAQPRFHDPDELVGPSAAGAPHAWTGGPDHNGFGSTLALPDAVPGYAPGGRVPPAPQSQSGSHQYLTPLAPPTAVASDPMFMSPGVALAAAHPGPGGQANVETKMSLPRPAAVAQWLMEQGDVEIQGPRSTAVIIAIAALATICVLGVGGLIIFKVRTEPRPDPRQVVIPQVTKPTFALGADTLGADTLGPKPANPARPSPPPKSP
ncbi:MAG: protein kinase [Myxococcota bacterium]